MSEGTSKPPCEQDVRCLRFIADYLLTHGAPPTIREIGSELGLTSTGSVASRVYGLERRGYLIRRKNKARSVLLTAAARALLAQSQRSTP